MKRSDCCDAIIYGESDLCSECKEHCEAKDDNDISLDELFGIEDEFDSIMRVEGKKIIQNNKAKR